VDFADFQVFRANYGQSGRFWEDGDFNHDGRVDRTDWTLMKPNLTGLTQARAAETAAWETSVGTGTGTLPTVRVTSPASGAGFIAGSNVTINAEATAGSGSIVRVEFFQGSTRLGGRRRSRPSPPPTTTCDAAGPRAASPRPPSGRRCSAPAGNSTSRSPRC
jgi:hypothetical protein